MRRPWFTLLFNVFVLAFASGQPINDNCENAISIPLGPTGGCNSFGNATASISGSNLDATPSTPIFQLASDFGDGPSLNNSAADVWYELTPSGNRLSVNLESQLDHPTLLLFQAEDCSRQLPVAWAKSADDTGILNLENAVEPGRRYFLLVGGASPTDQGSFTLSATTFDDCNTCASRRGRLSADPPPVNGTYQAGQSVQFCYQATFWDPGLSLEWLHGVEVLFGPGWDQSTLETFAPDACTAPSGSWAWYDSWQSCNTDESFGPGFAFDAEYGLLCPGASRLDGEPGNNFGDGPCSSVTAGPLPLEFCWTIQVSDNFATPQEANLNLEIGLLGDGYSGSWMQFSCGREPATIFYATALPDAGLLPAINIVKAPCATDCDGIATISGGPAGIWLYELTDENNTILYSALAQPGTDTLFNLCPGAYHFEASNLSGTMRQAMQVVVEAGLSPEAHAGFVPGCLPGVPIQLIAGVNINGSTTTYQWTGPNGFASSLASPSADEPGAYFLQVEVDGCRAPLASIQAETGVPEISCEAFPNSIIFSWANEPFDTAYAVDVLSGQSGTWLSATAFEVSGLVAGEEALIELTKRGTGLCSTAVAEATCQALSCPLPMITPDTTICRGEEIHLWVNIPPNTVTTWSPPNGLSCTDCIAPLASPSASTTYQANISYPDGCVATREVAVNVSSLPESILPNSSMPFCLGEPLEICLPEGNEYLWISPVGFITTGNCINFPITTELLTGTHIVRVTLPGGCEFYETLTLYSKNCADDSSFSIGFTPYARPGGGAPTSIKAFPNPVRSLLRVEIAFNGPKVLQLFRMDGQRMLHLKTEEPTVEIATGHLPSGAYWLEVSAKEGRERLKIIIIR